ncbi:MAG: hypothetical protein CMP14_08685 [Rickettsiales bacterium]|nr:hypothetical protein [Rickettsiales bacterium]
MLALVEYFLPEPSQWLGLASVLASLCLFSGLGRIYGVAQDLPGVSVLLGWSVLAAVLTISNVFGGWFFMPVFGCLSVIGIGMLIWNRHALLSEAISMRAIFVLGLPLILIIAAKAPSEVDSFTHWLPNGLFIWENDQFIRSQGPAGQSVYPGFPYNVTFLFYVVSRIAGEFVENAIVQFNVIFLLLFAALLGGLLRRPDSADASNTWRLGAFLILVATLLNPVFVRRIWLTSYPDMATSVVVAYAGIAAWVWIQSAANPNAAERGRAITFALLLALLVNIKQANLVLVVALLVSTGMVAIRDREIQFSFYVKRLPILIGMPLVAYLTWRYYLIVISPLAENKISAISDWPIDRLPELLRYMGVVVYRKALYFALSIGFVIWGFRCWIKRSTSPFDRLAIIVGSTFFGYNLFLFLIFIVHFGGYPQSYWRFNTHVGYLIMAATVFGFGRLYRYNREKIRILDGSFISRIGILLIIAVLVLQIATTNYWRYDLEVPKPMLRDVGRELSKTLPQNATIGLIVPGDQGNFTSMFKHYVGQSRADLKAAPINNDAELLGFMASAGSGPTYIWSYCPAEWISRRLGTQVMPGSAALLLRNEDGWSVIQYWPHRKLVGLVKAYKHFDISKCTGNS